MKLYRNNAATQTRLKFGRRMIRRLRGFEQTTRMADVLQGAQLTLKEATNTSNDLEERVDDAADDAAIGEFKAEAKVRRVWNLAKTQDGDRVGTITKLLFPQGLTPVVAPKGQAQLIAIEKLLERATESKIPEVVAALPSLLPLLQEAQTLLATPYGAYLALSESLSKAKSIEKIRADEHRRTIDALFGEIRATFPGNKPQQELLVPPLPSKTTKTKDDNDSDDEAASEN